MPRQNSAYKAVSYKEICCDIPKIETQPSTVIFQYFKKGYKIETISAKLHLNLYHLFHKMEEVVT